MRTLFKRWGREKEGATAVEFALVGIPFVLMIVGTIEMALMFTAQSVLQESTYVASRLIRTGQLQLQQGGDAESLFRDAVCDFSALMIPCNDIQFTVRTVPDFSDADDNPPFDADGNLVDEGFNPGGPSDVVLIRVAYNYPIRTPLMQPMLTNRNNSTRTMLSTVVLRTEPFMEE